MHACPAIPWHEWMMIGALALVGLYALARWLERGMDG